MKASRFLMLFPVLLLCACAHAPVSQNVSQGQDASALEAVNPRAKVHTELAAGYYARHQYSIALQEVAQALATDKTYAPAYNMSGLLHAALLEDEQAGTDFRHAIALAPQFSDAHNNYGYFLCSRKHYAAALEQFELAWKNPLYGTPEKALANAGQCALRMGRQQEAERYSKRALAHDQNQPQALITLAEIDYRKGNIAAARSRLARADAQNALNAAGLWLGVKIERKAGDREAEAEYAAKLRQRYPQSDETGWLLNGQFDRSEGDR